MKGTLFIWIPNVPFTVLQGTPIVDTLNTLKDFSVQGCKKGARASNEGKGPQGAFSVDLKPKSRP